MLCHLLRLLTGCLLLASCSLHAAGQLPASRPQQTLPASVARALQDAGIPQEAVSLVTQEVSSSAPQLSLHALTPRNPASLMKLVTGWAALALLGPDYRWQTEFAARTPPHDGILPDDIYLIAGADPHLDMARFWQLLRELRARGVRDIRGELILVLPADWPADTASSFDFDGQGLRPYNVLPYPLLVNFGVQRLLLRVEDDQVRVSSEPPSASLQIDNQLRLQRDQQPCGDWRARLTASTTPSDNGQATRLTLRGPYPQSCAEQHWYVHAQDAGQFVAGVFQALWQELGGDYSGRWRVTRTRPAELLTLAQLSSLPLIEVLRPLNKYSNNVMARQLFLTLGQTANGVPVADDKPTSTAATAATTVTTASAPSAADSLSQRASTRIKSWLAARHIATEELVIDNGAGLSRQARISATTLNQLLQTIWHDPLMPEYVSTLPLAGVDGTLRKHFTHAPLRARAYLKTGSLDNTNALAGFLMDRRGRWHSLVLLINHPRAQASRAAQEALLNWLYDAPE